MPAFFHAYHLPTLGTNCSNNYGPYPYPDKLIPLMVRRVIEGMTCRFAAMDPMCAKGPRGTWCRPEPDME
ncbi:MAG: hypothetical protein ACODAD_08210 [Planctomycetota bacterium]